MENEGSPNAAVSTGAEAIPAKGGPGESSIDMDFASKKSSGSPDLGSFPGERRTEEERGEANQDALPLKGEGRDEGMEQGGARRMEQSKPDGDPNKESGKEAAKGKTGDREDGHRQRSRRDHDVEREVKQETGDKRRSDRVRRRSRSPGYSENASRRSHRHRRYRERDDDREESHRQSRRQRASSRSRSRSRSRRGRHRRSSRRRGESRTRERDRRRRDRRRSYSPGRDRDRSRERRRRRRYSSPSNSRSRNSRSRSPSLPYVKASSGSTIPSIDAIHHPMVPQFIMSSMPFMPAGLPVNPARPNMPVRMPNLVAGAQYINPATRSLRRLYVGGIPNPCIDTQLSEFLSSTLVALGLVNTSSNAGRSPIMKCEVTNERGFAFVEFYDSSDCTACMQLDGIIYAGQPLRIRRPRDFVPAPGHVEPAPLGPLAIAALLAQKTGQPLPPELSAAAAAVPIGGASGAAGINGAGNEHQETGSG